MDWTDPLETDEPLYSPPCHFAKHDSPGLGLMQEVYKGNPFFVSDPTLAAWGKGMQEGGEAADQGAELVLAADEELGEIEGDEPSTELEEVEVGEVEE